MASWKKVKKQQRMAFKKHQFGNRNHDPLPKVIHYNRIVRP